MERETLINHVVQRPVEAALNNPGVTTLNQEHMNFFRAGMEECRRQLNDPRGLQLEAQRRLQFRYRVHRTLIRVGGLPRIDETVAVFTPKSSQTMTICAFNLPDWQVARCMRGLRYVQSLQDYVEQNDIEDNFIFNVLRTAKKLLEVIICLGEKAFTPEGQEAAIELYEIFENLPDIGDFVFEREQALHS
ncbi:unnamed protein product [Caenorhabditis brenneri]